MKEEIFYVPERKSILEICPDFTINFTHNMPNWWWRFWQFVLLGWKWRKVWQQHT